MMRRSLLVFVLLLAAACGQPPVRETVRIEFNDKNENVAITALTEFDVNAKTEEARARVETAQRLAESGMDGWSARMRRVDPESEQFVLHRDRGRLDRVSRTIVIPATELQRVFSDINATIDVTRTDEYRELAIYPGTSPRATREQQRQFEAQLQTWSRLVTRYLTAMHHLYSYLNDNPQRARYLYAMLLNEPGAQPVLEDEEPIVQGVVDAMQAILDDVMEQSEEAQQFADAADAMFNPFPAVLEVHVPGSVVVREGFNDELKIEPIDLLTAVASLEGRWISPDPLALAMREQEPTAEQLAALPRESTPVVNASDVSAALREKLTRPKQFVIRWAE